MALPRPIFREYIGPKSHPDNLADFPADIINPNIKEFHFIIAFASEKQDDNDKSGKLTGEFCKKWIVPNINGEKIRKLKDTHKNVKVVISIGGRGSAYTFDPADREKWPDNAKNSLIKIINDLKDEVGNSMIDGIDINYDNINPGDESVFASCIGSLIKSLKNDDWVSVVSIAPSPRVRTHYEALYKDHGSDIDWVNYQFYTHLIPSKADFEKLYRKLASETYTRQNLLAGFSTDPGDAGHLSSDDFLGACEDLIKNGELPGIFFWNANDSAVKDPTFPLERKAQNLLAPH